MDNSRMVTALIALPIVIGAIFILPVLYFALLMGFVILIAAWEWTGFLDLNSKVYRWLYVGAMLLALILAAVLPSLPVLLLGFITLLWALLAVISYGLGYSPCGFQYASLRAVIGFLLLVPCWTGVMYLRIAPQFGAAWILWVLVIVWAADSGAYFSGRKWGRRKLMERVSPNKTVLGFWGGVFSAFFIGWIMSLFFPLSATQRTLYLLLALAMIIFSVFGDLTVSLLKRLSNLKDSGNIFPGHGGMLDRIDSIISAMIVFPLGVMLLTYFGFLT